MSDSEQDVTRFVVSASLSSRFSPLVPDANNIDIDLNDSCSPSNNVFEPVQANSHSAYTHTAVTNVRPEIIQLCGSEFEKINNTFEYNTEVLKQAIDDKIKDNREGNADQEKSNSNEYILKSLTGTSDDHNDCNVDVNNYIKKIRTFSLEAQTDVNTQSDFSLNEFDGKEQLTKESRLIDDHFSGSTDGTLQNSEESSDLEGSVTNTQRNFKKLTVRNCNKMGNKPAPAPKRHSDDDTPDDSKSKCCQVPKRKIKDKGSRSNRGSRNDDLNFDSNEVYPFEGRSPSEQEINEPVELDPFEIVETDDIKFVPGAGTSDVIKSVSEPRFTTIAEENLLTEESHDPGMSAHITDNSPNRPFYVHEGNRLVEPGTATAHSTFEFKQVKPKTKCPEVTSDHHMHNYENVGSMNESNESSAAGRKVSSSSSSKSNSSSSSKDISRKNSKDARQKPSRKGKSKNSADFADNSIVGQDDRNSKTKKEKTQSVRDSEIDRNIDSVLMLTQTMFSQTKVPEVQEKDMSQPVALNQYENVGVCAKLESSGIVIRHKSNNNSNIAVQENTQNTKSDDICSGNKCGESKESNELNIRKQHYSKLSKDIVEISDSGTLIIKSLADLPSEGCEEVEDKQGDEYSPSVSLSSEDIQDDTDVKVPYEKVDKHSTETKKDQINVARDDKEIFTLKENVPPPSPLALEVLEEEAEDAYEEDEDDIDCGEDDRRKSEILEFTENVCKRLSHLLEAISDQEVEEELTQENSEPKLKSYEDHIYETIDGFSKLKSKEEQSNNNRTRGDKREAKVNHQISQYTDEKAEHLQARDDSLDGLTSCRSETEKIFQKQATSDDDLPDYFDPRQVSPPVIDSEIFDDNDSYEDTQNDSLFSGDVSSVVNINKASFKGLQYDNLVLENKDKNFSLPIQSFEQGLITDAPPSNFTEDIIDITPTSEAQPRHNALPELAKADEETPVQFDTSGRQSATCTESDIDVSEHRDDLSTDSMLADDEAEETMEILFTKTYTEPVEGAEVFLSCTVVNSAYKDDQTKSETWLSDEALEYFEANASEVMSTAFLKAKKEMKDIQVCLQSLRQQMEHFHSDCDDISLPEIPVDSLSPDYFGIPIRKAVTD